MRQNVLFYKYCTQILCLNNIRYCPVDRSHESFNLFVDKVDFPNVNNHSFIHTGDYLPNYNKIGTRPKGMQRPTDYPQPSVAGNYIVKNRKIIFI